MLTEASQSWKGIRISSEIWLEMELLTQEAFGEPSRMIEKKLVTV